MAKERDPKVPRKESPGSKPLAERLITEEVEVLRHEKRDKMMNFWVGDTFKRAFLKACQELDESPSMVLRNAMRDQINKYEALKKKETEESTPDK